MADDDLEARIGRVLYPLEVNRRDHVAMTLELARRCHEKEDIAKATQWAMRALAAAGPRADIFCLLGEIADEAGEFELAARWYLTAQQIGLCPESGMLDVLERGKEKLADHESSLKWLPVLHETPDPGHVVVVMTHLGAREDLVRRSMTSLQRAGIDKANPIVIVDRDHEGQAKTFFRAMRTAERQPRFSRMTLFEDDVIAVKNLIEYAARVRLDRVALLSWYTPHVPFDPIVGPGLLLSSAETFWGNQGITMPAETVRALLDSKELREWSTPHGADILIGKVMPEARVAYHFPPLVDHLGTDVSTVGPGPGPRRSSLFPGESFDALSLIPRI